SAKADVARVNYDVFGKFATRFYAALPGDNPISAAPDRRRRHGRRSPQQPVKIMRTDSVAACKLIQTPSIRLPRMSGERRAQRYDETHHFGRLFGQFARIKASEAPTDDADRAPLLGPELPQGVMRSFQNLLSQPTVDALSPASWRKPA